MTEMTIRERVEELFCEHMGQDMTARWVAGEKVFFSHNEGNRPASNVEIGDSLDRVELIMAIEDAFGIDIPDNDATGLETLDQIEAYLKNKALADQ